MKKHKPKYELTDETILFNGQKLFRIRLLRDLKTQYYILKEGDLGGFVGSEDNLSHEGTCWIHLEAKVFEDASVGENSLVSDLAAVSGKAEVGGHAYVGLDATVGGDATIEGTAKINPCLDEPVHITTGHFTSGYFFQQSQIDDYLADLKAKEQTHAQA